MTLILGIVVMAQPLVAWFDAERVADEARRYCWVGLLFWLSLIVAGAVRLWEARQSRISLRHIVLEVVPWAVCLIATIIYPAILVTGIPLDTQQHVRRYYDFFLFAPVLSVAVLILVFFTGLSRSGKVLLWVVSAVGAIGVMRLVGYYVGDAVQ